MLYKKEFLYLCPGFETMENYFLYQQADTLKNKGLIKLQPKAEAPSKLNVSKIPSSREILSVDTSHFRDRVIEQLPTKPTWGQIRYWQRRSEEKLLVDSSRYMKPIADYRLPDQTVTIAHQIILPEHPANRVSYDWLTVFLFLGLIIFASMRVTYGKYLANLFQSLFSYQASSRMFRERNFSLLHGSFRLEIFFYIVFSVFVFQVFDYYNVSLPFRHFRLYLFSLTIILGYFILKQALYKILSFIHEGVAETNEFLFNLNNYSRVLGLFIFPVSAMIAFSPFLNVRTLIIIGILLTAIFYLLSLYRGIEILSKKHFSIFYLFLYLCTLEFLPLLLIVKMVLV